MRILHVVPTYLPATRYGGPIYAVHGLCRALAAQGHEVDVFTTNVDGDRDSDVPLIMAVDRDGVRVHYFASPANTWAGLGRRLYVSATMRRALMKSVSRYDLLHLHSVFLWPTYAAARAAEQARVPYVVSPRGMLVPELIRRKSALVKRSWIRIFETHTFRHAAAVHFTAQREWDDARGVSIPLPDPFIVPNGIDLQPIMRGPRLEDTLLFLGRINWKKGLDRLLDAVSFIPEVKVVVAGNDEENLTPALKAQAERIGIADRIEFRGPVEGAAKEALLQTSTALVLPSLSENFGNVVLEAMGAGMPVIVSPEVGLADAVTAAGAGAVASSMPVPLAAAIRDLLHDREERARMGERGRELVNDRYTWDRVAKQMTEHYEAITAGSRRDGDQHGDR